jgi:hypothetical protein
MLRHELPHDLSLGATLDACAQLGETIAEQGEFTATQMGKNIDKGDIFEAAVEFDGDAILTDQED